MKLVELLARELKVWPEDEEYMDILCITQDLNADALTWEYSDPSYGKAGWIHQESLPVDCIDVSKLATDHATAIVTRADWEAEVARLSAAKPEWIRHRGGKCPVEAGVLVDIRLRNGNVSSNRKPESLMWGNRVKCDSDIMDYRICEPEQASEPEQSPRERIKELHALAMAVGMGVSVENPLTWRDRIREIDITVEALEEERAGLVQQLEDEGFRLIGEAVQPVVDMRDWRNWKVGDLIEVIDPEFSGLSEHRAYLLEELETPEYVGMCPALLMGADTWLEIDNMRWHSRPSA